MCDSDTIQFVMFTVWMFTFVGTSRGHLCDSTAFLLLRCSRVYRRASTTYTADCSPVNFRWMAVSQSCCGVPSLPAAASVTNDPIQEWTVSFGRRQLYVTWPGIFVDSWGPI